jgi:metal-sulfur cluster biosynthetic enzyme
VEQVTSSLADDTWVDETQVRAALNAIVDPCSVIAGTPIGLDEMGLVRQVTIRDHHVDVVIGVTEPMCLMGITFLRDARAVLGHLGGVESFDVRFDHDLRWNESMMSPQAQISLGKKRARR